MFNTNHFKINNRINTMKYVFDSVL